MATGIEGFEQMSEAKRQPREDPEATGKDTPDNQGGVRGGGDASGKSTRTNYDPPSYDEADETIPTDPPDNSGGGIEW